MGSVGSSCSPGHAPYTVLQALTFCTSVLLLCMVFQHATSTTGSMQLGTTRRFALQRAYTGSSLVMPERAAPTTTDRLNQSGMLRSREWYLSHPSTHCARHQLPAQGHVNQSPFASGDTIRSMADFTMDEYSDPPGGSWNSSHIKPCDIIFVKTDLLKDFFKTQHPQINVTYILVSHNSDYSVPVDSRSPCNSDSCTKYLNDAQLGHWYSQNMLSGYGNKTTPMPIGLAAEYWPHGNSRKVLEVAQSAPSWEARTTLLHMAISADTHFERSTVIEQMSRMPGALHVRERVDYLTYLQQVANSKFVVAPRGNGIDTHRAWEAIWLGAVPIIQKSPMDWLYEGMPVLLVEHFSMVNSSLLESYAAAKNGTADNTEKAWAVYWNQELQQRQRLLCGTAGYQLRG